MSRPLAELLETKEPAWPTLQGWMADSSTRVDVLEPDPKAREEELLKAQVTTRSPLGAVLYETGGLLFDYGWVRVLGSGHRRLPRTLSGWNAGRTLDEKGAAKGYVLVGDDVLGGFFAINGGGLPGADRQMAYLAPDSLKWEPMELAYSDWLRWMLGGKLAQFYKGQRWKDWETEVATLDGDRSLFFYPPLFAQGPDLGARQRSAVPVSEAWGLIHDVAAKFGEPQP